MPPSFDPSPMVSFKPLPIARLTPLSPPKHTRIGSAAWSSAFSTTKTHSMSHLRALSSTTGRSVTSTSPSATGYIRRQNGSTLTMMELSLATQLCKDLTSSHTSSTYTQPPTTALTRPLTPYPCGSATCSLVQAATFTSFKPWWLTPTTGAWHKKSHATERSMMMSPHWQSNLKSTNVTSMPCGPASCHVSPALCLPMLQNALSHSTMWLGRWVQYTQVGKGLTVECGAPMYMDAHCRGGVMTPALGQR
jgi:hypothetical protein